MTHHSHTSSSERGGFSQLSIPTTVPIATTPTPFESSSGELGKQQLTEVDESDCKLCVHLYRYHFRGSTSVLPRDMGNAGR